jgi:hypothetical protein
MAANDHGGTGNGNAGDVQVSKGTRRFAVLLLFLVLVMGAGAIVSSYLEYHHFEDTQTQQYQSFAASQKAQRLAAEAKLCTTLDHLAALKAPAGNVAGNPSRAYEQELASTLAQLKPDVGCAP